MNNLSIIDDFYVACVQAWGGKMLNFERNPDICLEDIGIFSYICSRKSKESMTIK